MRKLLHSRVLTCFIAGAFLVLGLTMILPTIVGMERYIDNLRHTESPMNFYIGLSFSVVSSYIYLSEMIKELQE